MGSGDWFKTLISLKKAKGDRPKRIKGSTATRKLNGFKGISLRDLSNGTSHPGFNGKSIEDIAAIRIQTAFRGFKARKNLRLLKGIVRFKVLSERQTVTKQSSSALRYIHSWSKIQSQISARRQYMVTEGRIKQKKLENQLKLEAELHDLEVEWHGGSDTMEDILARIQQREEAAVKRERAMAYAFSHQWRANSSPILGKLTCELGKANWGWSWTERWIAARPWESRLPARSISPKKVNSRQTSKAGSQKSPPAKKNSVASVKPTITTKVKNTTGQAADSKVVSLSPTETKGETTSKQEQHI